MKIGFIISFISEREKSYDKSAGVNLYQSTPFSYVQKGEDLNVDIGEKLTLSFKTDEPEDEPNYEYTQQE